MPERLRSTGFSLLGTVTTGETVSSTSTVTAASLTVPSNEPANNALYEIDLFGLWAASASSPTLTFTVNWGSTALGSNAFTMGSVATSAPARWRLHVLLSFTSGTLCWPNIAVDLAPGNAAGTAVNRYLLGNNTTAGLTVTTSSAQAFAVTMAWSANSSSNAFWVNGGRIWKAA